MHLPSICLNKSFTDNSFLMMVLLMGFYMESIFFFDRIFIQNVFCVVVLMIMTSSIKTNILLPELFDSLSKQFVMTG